jgi:hypothetical protein
MIGFIFGKVMWVGRATVFLVGLALILALTVGLASAALAGTGVGATYNLGKTNAVNAVTTLIGSVAGPSLKVDNNSADANATALNLQVEPGKAPMKINSSAKVANLNSDKLDGKNSTAFFSGRTYTKEGNSVTGEPELTAETDATCDPGDPALSGGYFFSVNEHVIFSERVSGDRYQIRWFNTSSTSENTATANVTCADFPPLRP